ncbi:SMP-30/gluconolactonase/LRE family protein [Acidithrix ferrooxidans]|uniref:L-arabinolactonase n=1 Tax=Acidithrix ferrooxidans TaxID=1280514 RepID=A0A0D8HFZ3_9ACTN|nr:SMP-30/gluconolactonase/LRE family protein [Acidithrix ferrooxidans]KJF16814.1 L-arabinolactonase [Acidithrix ferrooxidans]
MTLEIEIIETKAELGESPFWDQKSQSLFWVDIDGSSLNCLSGDHENHNIATFKGKCTPAIPQTSGGFLVGVDLDLLHLQTDGSTAKLCSAPSGDRFNDGKCDPLGRFYIGTLSYARTPKACGLYRYEADNGLVPVIEDVTLSNGMGWSPAGDEMYFIDTPTRQLRAFEYDLSSGTIGATRIVVDFGELPGNPDGLCVDSEGGIWVSMIRSGDLRRYHPNGSLDSLINLGYIGTTSCCFGGENLEKLYVTSGAFLIPTDQRQDYPTAGSIFVLEPGVQGLPSVAYSGL